MKSKLINVYSIQIKGINRIGVQSCNFWLFLQWCFSWISILVSNDGRRLVTSEDWHDKCFEPRSDFMGLGKDGSLNRVDSKETASLLVKLGPATAESNVVSNDDIVINEFPSILAVQFASKDNRSDEIVLDVRSKQITLHKWELLKIAICLLKPGVFYIKEILWIWPYASTQNGKLLSDEVEERRGKEEHKWKRRMIPRFTPTSSNW